ncbi:MAG TPA: PDZ domain-containing protein [Candidatus Cybelea sp.]|nr:PDZ domain-containing protein [Candidatus Cybelea sp.]
MYGRLALVVIIAAAIFVCYDAFLPPLPDFGLHVTNTNRPFADQHVTSVAPDSPAARAGILAGDTVSFGSTPLERAEAQYVQPGTRVSVSINGTRTAALVAPGTSFQKILIIPLIIRLAFLAIAALLAWRRPDDPSARALILFLLCFGLLIGLDNTLMPTPLLSVVVLQMGSTILLLLGTGAAATFAANFPSGVARPAPRIMARIAQSFVAAAIALAILGTWFSRLPSFLGIAFDAVAWLFVAAVGLMLAILVVAYVQGAPSERERRRWVFLMLGVALFAVLIDVGVQLTAGYSALVDNASLLFIGIIPFGLAYVILRHRVIDVGFVINRAIIYGAVSLIIVGTFTVVETLASNFIEQRRAGGIALQLAVGLTLGFSIRYIHARVECVVDALLFRQRHLDEAAIADFTNDAHYITDPAVLLERCIDIAIRHGHATEAGIWPRDYPNVGENDPALVAMRARRVVPDLHATRSTLPGAMAFPMIVRGELIGALVCGNKERAEAYAPDEKEALRGMASAVGHALDALRIRELEERVRLLESAQPLHV